MKKVWILKILLKFLNKQIPIKQFSNAYVHHSIALYR